MTNSESNICEKKYILQNQQNEIRAYDQKAGYYIASNAGLFVIALFTLCIFGRVNGEIAKKTYQINHPIWWLLLILTSAYIVLFCVSNIKCLLVLFPRHAKSFENENIIDKKYLDALEKSITNYSSKTLNINIPDLLNNNIIKLDSILEAHIRINYSILKKKDKYCHGIVLLSLFMSIILLVTVVLLFIF